MWSPRALLFLFLVVVGACASGSDAGVGTPTSGPKSVLDAARARTAASPSGEFNVTVAAPGFERVVGAGAFSTAQHSYRYQPDPATEIRLADGRLYVRSAEVARRIGVGTEWMTGRVDDPAAAFGASDPLALMDLLGGTTGPVVDAGDGRFGLTVSPSAAMAAASSGARERLHTSLAAVLPSPSLLDRSLSVVARVDAAGFVDQLVIDLGGGATLTVALLHLGEPVSIDAPPSSQVTDVGAMLGG